MKLQKPNKSNQERESKAMSSNEVNNRDLLSSESETSLFHNSLNDQQSPAKNPSMEKSSDEILDPDPISVFVEPQNHENSNLNPIHNPKQNPSLVQLNESDGNQGRFSGKKKKNSDENCIVISDDEKGKNVGAKKRDGRTHSLPHNKYGPYVCPRCNGSVFATSQLFAAHVSSAHYKHETLKERQKRRAAKYKKKNLQVVQTSEGLTVLTFDGGEDSLSSSSKTQKGRGKKAKKGEIKNEVAEENFNLVDVKIKVDYK